NLLINGKPQTVLGITERLLRKEPGHWEALYREGLALAALDKPAEAARRFRALLDLRVPDDDDSVAAKALKKKVAGRPAGARGAKDKTPKDPRALWDWYYLGLVRQEQRDAYEAARDLARANGSDPSALWVYLTSLPARAEPSGQRVNRGNDADAVDKTPPLPA